MSLYLLSLGELAAIKNLICHVQSQYINCSWCPPFSLVPIHDYIINVVFQGEVVTQNTTSSTTWQYCPSQFGTYTISIAGNNSAGKGMISTTSLDVPRGILTMVTNIQFITLILVNISNLTTTFIRSVNSWILNVTIHDLVSYIMIFLDTSCL